MSILSSFGKKGASLGLLTRQVDIEDTDHLSRYFAFAELPTVFAAGKNSIAFHGTDTLQEGSEILIECIDSEGQSLYLELAKTKDIYFSDVAKYVVSIHVYNEAANGSAKLVLIGTTTKGEFVRWVGNITIDKTLKNDSKVRFWNRPSIEVRSLLYPVVDLTRVSEQFPPPTYRSPAAVATVSKVIDTVQVTNGGSGYTSVPTVTIPGGAGYAVLSGGAVVYIVVTNRGSGYTTPPIVTIAPPTTPVGGSTGGTTPAAPLVTATAVATITGVVHSVALTYSGSGYNLDTPTVTFRGGGGTGAAATVTIVNGEATAITVTDGGRGYTTAPTITFTSPQTPTAPNLNAEIDFDATFYTIAAFPKAGTFARSVKNQKQIDYRLAATDIREVDAQPILFPSGSFNTQMEGKELTVHITKIRNPLTYSEETTDVTQSFFIEKVIDSRTVMLDKPYYYERNGEKVVAEIIDGRCFVSYHFIKFNTDKESNLLYTPDANTTQVEVKKSYAEITYRNLTTFSGYIARHKIYRRSLFYPGEFELISDDPLNSEELLSDNIGFNKAYNQMGKFYHQPHIAKYWFTSSQFLNLTAQSSPINSMKISSTRWNLYDNGDAYSLPYVIAKNDTIGVSNNATYYPFVEADYNNLTGSSYNSNFISLKKDCLYVLSANVIIEKNVTETKAGVAFYFKSSIADIAKEKTYDARYGMLIGKVTSSNAVDTQYFDGPQKMFFTPTEDYFGTLVIVPHVCDVTLSDVSLKIYSDAGFNPDVLVVRIPFPLNVQNEAFELKAELFDKDSTLVYSDLKTTHTFDPNGISLATPFGQGDSGTVVIHPSDPDTPTNINNTVNNITVEGDLSMPNLDPATTGSMRYVAWQNEKLVYTKVSNLFITRNDYLSMSVVESGTERTVSSLAVKYDGANKIGRKVVITSDGTKTEYPLDN